MSLKLKGDGGGGNFVPAPAGIHIGRIIMVIDLGTHYDERYNKTQQKIQVRWELPEELMMTDNGEVPYIVSKRYTASKHELATLRQHMKQWKGRDFTAAELEEFDVGSMLYHQSSYLVPYSHPFVPTLT